MPEKSCHKDMVCRGEESHLFSDLRESCVPQNSHHKKRKVKWIFVLKGILEVSEITHVQKDCVHMHQ